MKKLSKEKWKRIGLVTIFLLLAPLMPEIALLADFVGIELALTFLVMWLVSNWQLVVHFVRRLKTEIIEIYLILLTAYVFRPKVYFSHVSMSVLILVVSGSVLASTLLWTPAVVMSAGGFGPLL